MGVSTDAILFFGVEIHGEACGLENECPWPNSNGWDMWCAPDGIKKELELLKVDFDVHCHSDYPEYFIYAKESHQMAFRGSSTDAHMNVEKDAEVRLMKAIELLKIKSTLKPKWMLVSYWG
jgi:hypothetical protein